MVFDEKKADVGEELDARKTVYNGDKAWAVIKEANQVHVAVGKKMISFDPATADKDEMLKKITGRTGNLRAPTLKKGDEFYVGFSADMYDQL